MSLIIIKCFCFVFPKKPTDFLWFSDILFHLFFPLHFILHRVSRQYYWHLLFSFCCTTQVKIFLFYFILYISSPLMLFLFFQFIYTFFLSFLHAIVFSTNSPYIHFFPMHCVFIWCGDIGRSTKSQQQHKICMKCHKMIFNRCSHSNSVKQLSCVDSCHVALPRMCVYLYSYFIFHCMYIRRKRSISILKLTM